MAEVIWTEPALDGLDDIAEYVALSNVPAAEKLVQSVFSKTERLADHPDSGKHPAELTNLPYREVVVNPCRVIYRHEEDVVYILYVVRQERDLRSYLASFQ